MAAAPRVLAFAGSTRTGSFNKKLIAVGAAAARAAGAEVTLVDLRDLAMPLYDGDLEAASGLPANAQAFKDLLLSHQAFLVSTPEYNSSLPGVLKNALDWASRGKPGEPPLAAFEGRVAGLLSASPGGLGGLRSLTHLRAVLESIRVMVVPDQFALARAHEAFDDAGRLKDPKAQHSVEAVARRLVDVTRRMSAS
jgi:chromate reductase, NAD(P)H dehydrogenase (quinone)